MESGLIDLAKYRLDRANEDLDSAKREFKAESYRLALNRSYYAIFHGLRAVNALDEFDSSKHTGVIAHFNQYHVKRGEFPKEISRMISSAMLIRQKSDYDDFYIASKDEAEKQLNNAKYGKREIIHRVAMPDNLC